ncbi:hypothetical protein F2P79_010826 [Pimephales promelas]|nr:hypothetical protein F2P79_010826 [Pimephales promelas]
MSLGGRQSALPVVNALKTPADRVTNGVMAANPDRARCAGVLLITCVLWILCTHSVDAQGQGVKTRLEETLKRNRSTGIGVSFNCMDQLSAHKSCSIPPLRKPRPVQGDIGEGLFSPCITLSSRVAVAVD